MSVLKRWNGSSWEMIGPAIEDTRYSNNNNMIASEYDPTETYVVGDLVIYNDVLYKCISEITTAEAWTAAHWNETDIVSEIGNTSNELFESGTGANSVQQVTSAGNENIASGDFAIALGSKAVASGLASVVIGAKVSTNDPPTATGAGAVSLGGSNQATNNYAAAIGMINTASGNSSVALGRGNQSTAGYAVTGGLQNIASGTAAVALGRESEASGAGSAAIGYKVISNGRACAVLGQANIADTSPVDNAHGTGSRELLMIVGNGDDENSRSNALTLDWDGNLATTGKMTVGTDPVNDMDVTTKQYVDTRTNVIFSNVAKHALLSLLEKVAYIDEDGQEYLDTLEQELFAAAVTSITAVYTPSGTVYDTDDLDSLRDDLMVMANFLDGTSAVVTTYLLSGTLTAGTSTITVGYSGKIDTITVNVTHDDSADWDYIWRYTDGLPPTSDWSYSTSGGSAGFVRKITDDGMQMGSKYGTNSTYKMDYAAPSILSAGGGAAEFSFYIPSGTNMAATTNFYYFAIAIGNGTNGLRVKVAKAKNTTVAKFCLQDDSSAWYGGTTVANFSFDTPYIIRLEIDGTNLIGRIYINGSLAMDNIDLSTINSAGNLIMYTGGVTDPNDTSIAFPITIQYVKIKYGAPESAVVA